MLKKHSLFLILTLLTSYCYASTPTLFIRGWDSQTSANIDFKASSNLDGNFTAQTFAGIPAGHVVYGLQVNGSNRVAKTTFQYADYLYVSSNNGSSYSLVSLPSSMAKLGAVSYQEGVLTIGGTNSQQMPHPFMVSTDLGNTFSQMSLNGIPEMGPYQSIQTIDRFNTTVIVNVMDLEMGMPMVYKSTDSGNSFSALTLPEDLAFIEKVIVSNGAVVVSGYDWDFNYSGFKETSDLGTSYHEFAPNGLPSGLDGSSLLTIQKAGNTSLVSIINPTNGELEVYSSIDNAGFSLVSIPSNYDKYSAVVYLGLAE